MSSSTYQIIRAGLLGLVLVGCNSESSSDPQNEDSNDSLVTLSGRAPMDAPIAGAPVDARCMDGSGFTRSVTSNNSGRFEGRVERAALPCALRVDGGTAGTRFHSYAEAAGNVNITPLTDLIIAVTTSVSPAVWYDQSDRPQRVQGLAQAQQEFLGVLRSRGYDLPGDDFDPFRSPFTPGDAADQLLDQLMTQVNTLANVDNYTAFVDLMSSGNVSLIPQAPGTADNGENGENGEQRSLNIGTGDVTGWYYSAGGAICLLINTSRAEHGFSCSVESTEGSIDNLNGLRQGELDLAVVQSDWQYHAYTGSSYFAAAGPMENLRAVFTLHTEPFTVVARQDADVTHFQDLEGKRVNIGNPGSRQRETLSVLLQEMGWDTDRFALASELSAAEHSQALCDHDIDAFVHMVGHPSGSTAEVLVTCETRLVNVTGEAAETLVERHPYYTMATIPGGIYQAYRGTNEGVETFGVAATVVTTSDTSEEAIYQLVKAVFENFDSFRDLLPPFRQLDPEKLVDDARSTPLHKGAERYFREAGLLKGF